MIKKSKYRFTPDPLEHGCYWVGKPGDFGWVCIVRKLWDNKWEATWNGKRRIRRTRKEAVDDLLQALEATEE